MYIYIYIYPGDEHNELFKIKRARVPQDIRRCAASMGVYGMNDYGDPHVNMIFVLGRILIWIEKKKIKRKPSGGGGGRANAGTS